MKIAQTEKVCAILFSTHNRRNIKTLVQDLERILEINNPLM